MRDEVNFLHVDKHESYLQTDAIIFGRMFKHSLSSQISNFAMSLYLKKEVWDEVGFFVCC